MPPLVRKQPVWLGEGGGLVERLACNILFCYYVAKQNSMLTSQRRLNVELDDDRRGRNVAEGTAKMGVSVTLSLSGRYVSPRSPDDADLAGRYSYAPRWLLRQAAPWVKSLLARTEPLLCVTVPQGESQQTLTRGVPRRLPRKSSKPLFVRPSRGRESASRLVVLTPLRKVRDSQRRRSFLVHIR